MSLFLGGRYHVTWTDRHMTPAAWRSHAFTPRQWDALLSPPPCRPRLTRTTEALARGGTCDGDVGTQGDGSAG